VTEINYTKTTTWQLTKLPVLGISYCFMFFKYFLLCPINFGSMYFSYFIYNKPELGARINPGMALTPFSPSID